MKVIPKFKTEAQEQEFWANNDATEYFDISKAEPGYFPNLVSSTEKVTVELPSWMVDELKLLANKYNVSYGSLIKIYLGHSLADYLKPRRRKLIKKHVVHNELSAT